MTLENVFVNLVSRMKMGNRVSPDEKRFLFRSVAFKKFNIAGNQND